MTDQQKPSRAMTTALWITQILLALFMTMGAVMKFMPIEKISLMMPWTGQMSPVLVRLLGLIDLAGALGLVLPGLLQHTPQLTVWAAFGVIALMICAMVFHVSRGEAPVIGFNILCAALAAFIAWGRSKK